MRSRVHALVDRASEHLGFAPSVRLDGLLDTSVDEEIGEHLLATVREALSNVARHAHATATSLNIEVGDDVTVRVEDNGVGIPEGGRRSGLRNIGERAEKLGGTCKTGPGTEGGTVLTWCVPLNTV
nr:ATP-binding protein [Actinomadura madurae]